MVALFKFYESCAHQPAKELGKTASGKFSFSVMAGINRTSLKFRTSDSYAYIGEANFSHSYDACAGIKARWLLTKHLSRYFIDIEAFYTNYTVEGNYVKVQNSTLQFDYKSTYGARQLQFNVLTGLNVPKQFGSVFCHIGVLSAVKISETNVLEIEKTYFSDKTQTTQTLIENSRKMEVGLLMGLGITLHHFSLEGRLQRSNGPSDILGLGTPRLNMMLLLGYQF